jgi:ZIP family zinc transporter
MTVDKSENVGIAMLLVVVAGGATGLGASVVFFPSIVKLASRRVLAGSLGFSGGVMTYVSFIEIFQKAQQAFLDEGFIAGTAYSYATLCFFGGVLVMMVSCFRFAASL